jgi:MoaA/NifB/PqqE/SkfB family radical SAM enzyme
VWGDNNEEGRRLSDLPKDIMPIESIDRILDEVKDYRPTIAPGYWMEPLAMKHYKHILMAASVRDIPVSLVTNGLLITEQVAEFLVEHVTMVSVSIDATTPEVLVKTRATDKLDEIKAAVHLLLEKRGNAKSPRITVSFTAEECNADQSHDFLEYWIRYVDAVKINDVYTYTGTIESKTTNNQRIPCREIYDAMIIDYNGDARLCCLDGLRQTNVGNVLKDGVLGVWHGEELTRIRRKHEENSYDDLPFCRDCSLWSNYNIYDEKEENGMLVRSSLNDQTVFYNRIDRLGTFIKENERVDLKVDEFLGDN